MTDEIQAINDRTLQEIQSIGDETAERVKDEGGDLIQQDLIAKVNAGAQLTFAVWSLPKDVVLPLFKGAPSAFTKAFTKACDAYGIGGH